MKIDLENVGIIKKCSVEFIPGINLIVGSSGSGKSTLMKCIHNMVANEFTDADIMFGCNTMSATINNNEHTVTYERSVRPKGDKCKYVVDGNTYVKLGRTSLPAVTDVLKFGDICINGDDVNFNFNLQFSSPFLIFGSQSTLYNVLTYRSNFDISSMNDYYMSDVKSNNSEITSSNKLKEKLESNLSDLESQADKLKPVEQLYSDFVAYKHSLSDKNEIELLNKMLNELTLATNRISDISEVASLISSTECSIGKVIQLHDYTEKTKQLDSLNSYIANADKLSSLYECSIKDIETLLNTNSLQSLMNEYESSVSNSRLISQSIESADKRFKDKQFADDLIKQRDLILARDKCIDIICNVSYNGDVIINHLSDLIVMEDKLANVSSINQMISDIISEDSVVESEMSSFEICPLCSKPLNSHRE